jgi:hypothetical protein
MLRNPLLDLKKDLVISPRFWYRRLGAGLRQHFIGARKRMAFGRRLAGM